MVADTLAALVPSANTACSGGEKRFAAIKRMQSLRRASLLKRAENGDKYRAAYQAPDSSTDKPTNTPLKAAFSKSSSLSA